MTSLPGSLPRGFLSIQKRWEGELCPFQVTPPVGNSLTNHGKRSIIRAISGNSLSPYPMALDTDTKLEVIDTSLSRLTPIIHQFSGWEVDMGFPTYPAPNEVYYEFTIPNGMLEGQWDSIYLMGKKTDSKWAALSSFVGFYDTWGEKSPGQVWTIKYTFTITALGSP